MWNSPKKYVFYDNEDFLRQNENRSSNEHVTWQPRETPTTRTSPSAAQPASTATQITRATSGITMPRTEHGYITQSSPTQFPSSSSASSTATIKCTIPEVVSGTARHTEQRPHLRHVTGTADENILYSAATDPSYTSYGQCISSADFNQPITTRVTHRKEYPLSGKQERTTTQYSPMLPTSLLQSSAGQSLIEIPPKTRYFRGLRAAPGVKRRLAYEETGKPNFALTMLM